MLAAKTNISALLPPIRKDCALCLREVELCNSHIIPEFAYKPAYDELHRMHVIPGHAPEESFMLQKGLRHELLCKDCETFLNTNYEDPFKRFWIDGQQLEKLWTIADSVIRGIDYAKFKLFHLSILWRASVSRHPAFFRIGDLGPHGEIIREMLLTHTAGSASQYPIYCGAIIDDDTNEVCEGLVQSPFRMKLWGVNGFDFAFCGCRWLYFTSPPGMTMESVKNQLTEQGTLFVPRLSFQEGVRRFYEQSRKMAARVRPMNTNHLRKFMSHRR